jgi:hypothetical protein
MKTLEDKIKVMQAALEGKQIEFKRNMGITWITYDGEAELEFSWHLNDYRVKDAVPLTKPSINWDHVHPDFKWIATDKDGQTYLFSECPYYRDDIDYWTHRKDSRCIDASCWSSYVPGTCDWKDSLVKRPEEW